MSEMCTSEASGGATPSPPPLAGEGQGMHQGWRTAGCAESNGPSKHALSPPLPRKRGREQTELAARFDFRPPLNETT